MSAEETLKLIAKQWCTLEDIMKLLKDLSITFEEFKEKVKDSI